MLGVYVFTSTGIIEKLKIQSFKKKYLRCGAAHCG